MYKANNSLSRSVIYNIIKNFFRLIFPIITFSYASRVLGVEGLGKVNFAKAYSMYFVLFAMFGTDYYGTREAAKVRDNKEEFTKFTQEVFSISFVTTFIALVLYVISIFWVDKLKNEYSNVLFIYVISIVLSGVGLEWVFQAVEEYKYITIRTILFQGLSLILMIAYVKNSNDYVIYAFITVLATSGSLLLNHLNIRKYVSIDWKIKLNIKKHCIPLFFLLAVSFSNEISSILDSTMLGFIHDDIAVGFYNAGIKINGMVMKLITSIGMVLIPRLSFYVKKMEYEKMKGLCIKALRYILLIAIPATVGLFILSDEIIIVFSGISYIKASLTLRILSPRVLILSISTMLNQLIFIPMNKDREMLFSTVIGIIINIILNIIFIPSMAENGAAIATVFSEFAVMLICLFLTRKIISVKYFFVKSYEYVIASLPIFFVGVFIKWLIDSYWLRILLTGSIAVVVYFFMLYVMRNDCLIDIINTFKQRFMAYFKTKQISNKSE